VSDSVETEVQKLGLTLINVNFTDITDVAGVIDALGKRAAADAVQQARYEHSSSSSSSSSSRSYLVTLYCDIVLK
jgi:flotillin